MYHLDSIHLPITYSLTSVTDFLDILKWSNAKGNITSLDVEFLFTNVPIDCSINYMINHVCRDNTTPTLDIPESALRGLLECCTKEAFFTCPPETKYRQVHDGAMGSPLGVLLAIFFMGCVEEDVFWETKEPEIYCCYIDDVFINATNKIEIEHLRNFLQQTSGLIFTIESSIENSMAFSDVLINQEQETFNTDVHKPRQLFKQYKWVPTKIQRLNHWHLRKKSTHLLQQMETSSSRDW